jgi:1,4-dihydroxy-2-naphthoyl-CoA hydrolase
MGHGPPGTAVRYTTTVRRVPPPYDVYNFLRLLGIEIVGEGEQTSARLKVRHELIAGTGYLWAPVVVGIADALCAFGVSRHWPDHAASFTTIEAKANFFSSAKEDDEVVGLATPLHLGSTTQVLDARVQNATTDRTMAAYRCTQLMLYPRP